MYKFTSIFSLLLAVTIAVHIESGDDTLPIFTQTDCPNHIGNKVICINVHNPNYGVKDMIVAKMKEGYPTIYGGYLMSDKETKVAVVLADEDNADDTIVLQQQVISTCTRFSTKIQKRNSSCAIRK